MKNFTAVNSYVVGFILSLLLTLAAYFFVVMHLLAGDDLVLAVLLLAVIQFYVQLIFFLHLGRGQGARFKFWVFAATILVIVIFVGGSLWIMSNLNYHMSPQDMDHYLNDQSSF